MLRNYVVLVLGFAAGAYALLSPKPDTTNELVKRADSTRTLQRQHEYNAELMRKLQPESIRVAEEQKRQNELASNTSTTASSGSDGEEPKPKRIKTIKKQAVKKTAGSSAAEEASESSSNNHS
eukprot:GEZU01024815.1.p1 GENE.GEZU01024815.1~~GEZU01024815.1.p1  ORF type:complete len:123 (-),score=21.08 GEZU01024815.1:193-561(-)